MLLTRNSTLPRTCITRESPARGHCMESHGKEGVCRMFLVYNVVALVQLDDIRCTTVLRQARHSAT